VDTYPRIARVPVHDHLWPPRQAAASAHGTPRLFPDAPLEGVLQAGEAGALTNAPGPGPAHSLPATVAGVVLAGYAIVMLLVASRTTIRRDVA
jgi:hypothetical protein